MTAPTFVAKYDSTPYMTLLSGASDATASVTTAVGDVLLVVAEVSDAATTWATPTGGGLTWTSVDTVTAASRCPLYAWKATANAATTITVGARASNSSNHGGFTVYRYSGSDGIGTTGKDASDRDAVLTTSADSAVVVIVGDWAATDGASRTWLSVGGAPTEDTYYRDASWHSVYLAHYANVGAAGSKTVGLSAPTSTQYTALAVEILGASGAPAISLRAAGTATAATAAVTAVNPAVPTGTTTGDLSVLTVWAKPYGTTITTPGGWTKIGEHTNGTTAAGTDTGSTKVAVYVKESATVGAIGNLTLGGSPNSVGAVINSYAKTSGTWDYTAFTQGFDSANGANYSATGDAGIDVATGDWVLQSTAVNGDVGTQSAQTIGGMAGSTHATYSVRQSADTTTGTDSHGEVGDDAVTAGSSNAAPTFTYTNASSGSGTTMWLRLRLIADNPTGSGTATVILSASGTATSERTSTRTATVVLSASGTATGEHWGAGTATVVLTASHTATSSRDGSATAALTLSASGDGTKAPASTGTATLVLSASGTSSSERTSSRTATVVLSASGTSTSTRDAAATATVILSASGTASATKAGVGTATVYLSASGTATVITDGSGTATLVLSASGSATSSRTSAGTASMVLSASGSGSKVEEDVRTGSGTATLHLTASGTATKAPVSTGTASLHLSASGTGTKVTSLAGTATLHLTATGVGATTRAGAGTGTLHLTATHVAEPVRNGAKTAGLVLSATYVGAGLRAGASVATVVLSASGVGARVAASVVRTQAGPVTLHRKP